MNDLQFPTRSYVADNVLDFLYHEIDVVANLDAGVVMPALSVSVDATSYIHTYADLDAGITTPALSVSVDATSYVHTYADLDAGVVMPALLVLASARSYEKSTIKGFPMMPCFHHVIISPHNYVFMTQEGRYIL